MVNEGASSTTVREAEAEAHGDGAFAAPTPAEAPKKRRRARSAACPRTSQDRRKMGASNAVHATGAERPRRSVEVRAAVCSRRTDDGGGAGRSGRGGCCWWSRQGNTLASSGSAHPFRASRPLSLVMPQSDSPPVPHVSHSDEQSKPLRLARAVAGPVACYGEVGTQNSNARGLQYYPAGAAIR